VAPRVHRTDSIDYAVVISGEIDMELEKGTEVHLKVGDVLVQRGTVHRWINRGKAPCVMAFALIDAKSAVAGARCSARSDELSGRGKDSKLPARGAASALP